MASSSESLRLASVAGWARTLAEKGLEAGCGSALWAHRPASIAATARIAKKNGIAARRDTKPRVRFTSIILSDECRRREGAAPL